MDIDVSLDYGMTLLAALLIGTGFVLQQNAAALEPASRFLSLRLMADLVRSPRWLAGILAMVGGQVLAAWSIGHLTLSVVEPLLTTNLIWALILAVPLAKRAKSRDASPAPPSRGAPRAVQVWEVAGAAVLCVGVGLLSSARSAKPIGLSFGSFSHWPAAAAIAAIAFGCVHFGRRRQGRPRALLTGIAAGLVYGIQDALTRQTLEALQSTGISGVLTTWAPYALVGAGAIGIWLMQSAFSAGPLQLSLPAISAGEPLVGILLGIIVFGDRIQVAPLQLAVQAGGIAALVAGVILVARAPVLSHLRTWPPPGIPHGPISLPHPALPHLIFPHRGGSDPEAGQAPLASAPLEDGTGANGAASHEAGLGHEAAPGPALPAAPEALRELPARAPALAEAPQGGGHHREAEQQERHHVHAGAVLADLPDLEHRAAGTGGLRVSHQSFDSSAFTAGVHAEAGWLFVSLQIAAVVQPAAASTALALPVDGSFRSAAILAQSPVRFAGFSMGRSPFCAYMPPKSMNGIVPCGLYCFIKAVWAAVGVPSLV